MIPLKVTCYLRGAVRESTAAGTSPALLDSLVMAALALDLGIPAAHLSGVRGQESGARALRMQRWGTTTARTCAPIGWWTGLDVFAYLGLHDLPIHPAYAMNVGGMLDRERIRVASLGGKRGEGHGRAEWEARYYRHALAALDR